MAVQEPRLRSFHELMQQRVQRILLVSSLYDSFIMSEEGHLQESLLSQFLALNLGHFPDLIQVSTAADAVEHLGADDAFDLVIASVHAGDANAAELATSLRDLGHSMPVIALAFTSQELRDFVANNDTSVLERIFLWQGDVRILLAMVKYLEDRLNVANDTGVRGVPAILVVEDSIRYYSSFLPTIYSEIFDHTHRLLAEGLNLSQKLIRMRARPKVLLCETYEEAWDYFERYRDQILGVISDFEYPRDGELDKNAGLDLCSRMLEVSPDIRLVLQSSVPENRERAEEIGASFLTKGSPTLLLELRRILVDRFGFGEFVFRLPNRTEVDRASDLKSLAEKLETVPAASVAYHAERNHFSNWLKARTEFAVAEKLRPVKLADFESIEHLRAHLLEKINESRLEQHRTVIADFDRKKFEPTVSFTRVGGGSLGGKARGVAFANRILRDSGMDRRFPDVDIYVPPSVVLSTQVFDEFLEHPQLRDFAISDNPDEDVVQQFLAAPFPRRAAADLRSFLQRVKYPLAVRSSSLLEDSLSQPFAGVYRTYMLANNYPDLEVRWQQLSEAIKHVYASTFSQRAKAYLELTSFRLEEEKMAVMIQELVGIRHQDRFYPDFAGVARSHNFYPEPGHEAEDGVVAVALGLGRAVVEGTPCLRFCPKYPEQIITLASVEDALENSQREFYALDLRRETGGLGSTDMQRFSLEVAEEDGTLTWLGSTWTREDNRIVDGLSRAGVRLVSFAQVLKHDAFPLADILKILLELCSEGTGAPVEIEFAGDLGRPDRRPRFAFLQMRPMAVSKEGQDVQIGEVNDEDVVCRSKRVLGNGKIEDIRDLVIVSTQRFERSRSSEAALDVARFDAILRKEKRPYLLIGVGRWGSTDPHLGIPLGWSQITGARVIVEAGFKDFKVEPSQGTHFFQNLVSGNVGYFTVNPDIGDGSLDWDWLEGLDAAEETDLVRHVRLPRPLVIKMSGRTSEGVILKPSAS
ncbi:MAG: DUF5752 family protein [Planctomycetota bacterium]|nr:DUF5752 family protein [Planctomycetota bacterium]